jgi:GxxExxY protein
MFESVTVILAIRVVKCRMPHSNVVDDPQTYAIIGAAMEVHHELGCGFLESVYHDALQLELADRHIPFVTEVSVPVRYKGQFLASRFRVDLICFDNVVVELKAVDSVTRSHLAQVINYLKASGISRGLLLNFGTTKPEYRRVTHPTSNSASLSSFHPVIS